MRMTKVMLTFCVTVLIAMFANGAYLILHPHDTRHRSAPVPISYYKGGKDSYYKGGDSTYNKGEKSSYYKAGRPSGYELKQTESSTSVDTPVNILVLGLDEDGTRSDVILLFNFDPGRSGLNILSIARDTLVHTQGKRIKINALYSKGGETMMADKISEITGLPVHYYVTMNFKGFRKIIDTLGGVSFNVPFRMNYDDPAQNLHIHLRKGLQVLNGKKAEQLVRYRKGNFKGQGYSDGDIGRIKMQQEFIRALIRQKVNLRYISKADDIFALLNKYVKTNITVSDITQYIGSVGKIKEEEIETVTLPGTSKLIDEAWYFILDEDKTADAISSFYK